MARRGQENPAADQGWEARGPFLNESKEKTRMKLLMIKKKEGTPHGARMELLMIKKKGTPRHLYEAFND